MAERQSAQEEFARQLEEVREAAGGPTLDALARHSDGRLSTSGLERLLNGKLVRAVRWDSVDAFLSACLQYAKARGVPLGPDEQQLFNRREWKRRRAALATELEAAQQQAELLVLPGGLRLERYPRPAVMLTAEAASSRPSLLLLADHEVVPFTGRQDELAKLAEWRDREGERAAVAVLHGPGGQGKTRLAARLAEVSRPHWRVWRAVRSWAPAGDGVCDEAWPALGRRVLVVVDYAERWPAGHLESLLRELVPPPGARMKVLMLARSAGAWWTGRQREWRRQGYPAETFALPPLHPLPPDGKADGTPSDRGEAFTAARDRFAEMLGLAEPESVPVPDAIGDESFGLTLTVHMAALAAVDARLRSAQSPVDALLGPQVDPSRLSAYLLDRERDHWAGLYARESGALLPDVMAQTVYTATLTSSQQFEHAITALERARVETSAVCPVERVLREHAVCYPAGDGGSTYLEPLQPDRLGEDFLALTTPGHAELTHLSTPWAVHAAARLLEAVGESARFEGAASPGADTGAAAPLPTPRWTGNAVTVLIAAASRWPHLVANQLAPLLTAHPALMKDAGGAALAALAELRHLDTSVLEAVEAWLPENRDTDLDWGAAAVTARLTEHRLARTADAAERAELYSRLSKRLSDAGRHQQALSPAREALLIRRELAEESPSGHRAELARALNNYGHRLSCVERWEEALAATEEAVRIRRGPADAGGDPGTDLGMSLNNLSLQLLSLRRWDEALAAAEETVRILGRPDAFPAGDERAEEKAGGAAPHGAASVCRQPDLAMAHNNLGALFARMSQETSADHRSEALAATRKAVDGWRAAAGAAPERYRPDLAGSLSNLGALLAQESVRAGTGQDQARTVMDEAVELLRRLARTTGVAAHGPALIVALNNLGIFERELGDARAAGLAFGEADEVAQRLAGTAAAVPHSDAAQGREKYTLHLATRAEWAVAAPLALFALHADRDQERLGAVIGSQGGTEAGGQGVSAVSAGVGSTAGVGTAGSYTGGGGAGGTKGFGKLLPDGARLASSPMTTNLLTVMHTDPMAVARTAGALAAFVAAGILLLGGSEPSEAEAREPSPSPTQSMPTPGVPVPSQSPDEPPPGEAGTPTPPSNPSEPSVSPSPPIAGLAPQSTRQPTPEPTPSPSSNERVQPPPAAPPPGNPPASPPTPPTPTPAQPPLPPPSSSPPPQPPPPPPPACQPVSSALTVPSTGPGSSLLMGVVARTATDAWAVGHVGAGVEGRALALRWNGQEWAGTPSPSPEPEGWSRLNAVTAPSADLAWAVGWTGPPTGTTVHSLIHRWNGITWSAVPSPSPGTVHSSLMGVWAPNTTEAWSVGVHRSDATAHELVLHWDGSVWSRASTPEIRATAILTGVSGSGPGDVWAVGHSGRANAEQTLIEHWDGSRWTVVDSPNVPGADNVLHSVRVLAQNNAWAVGMATDRTTGRARGLVLHWDGRGWSMIAGPDTGDDAVVLYDVVPFSDRSVWVSGARGQGTLLARWDGSAWTLPPAPATPPGSLLRSMAGLSTDRLLAVGFTLRPDASYSPLLERGSC
ncbi:hypothetical protein [Streptomyces sp.]|uniref:hypothetical protein n=1 Tax=Streptomyces sp. TaxID=1931 RepID=UPI002D79C2FC|nr:hypothetical protein [Streptomyces sp.]HET6358172.1 hypothetical protein [Streptomyces sp.]